jgi:hypothetical protein
METSQTEESAKKKKKKKVKEEEAAFADDAADTTADLSQVPIHRMERSLVYIA